MTHRHGRNIGASPTRGSSRGHDSHSPLGDGWVEGERANILFKRQFELALVQSSSVKYYV